ncbi:Membrane-bound lytic murein transglycosylase C [bioreactor metagenome]|uniref:Membrane-bound lytic murein transglycosylase C n=1 Tax=bioreactor metagenome TaxID=1076179 RepID=A0A644UDJ0_9ZZZZ
MRRKLLTVWYALLILFCLELVTYGAVGFMADYYHKLIWERFNAGIKEYREVNSSLPYADFINRASRAEGISGQVVAAVIQAESSFQPRALSRSGAYGLMQVIPSTWRQVNNQIKACTGRHAGDCTSDCYFNPEINITIGTAYLGQLYKSYNGDMVRALAAYNAGPGEVSRYGGVPPFQETNEYIDRIITYWFKAQNKPLPSYSLQSEYWQDVRSTLGWLCLLTAVLIGFVLWRLLKRHHSWRWR